MLVLISITTLWGLWKFFPQSLDYLTIIGILVLSTLGSTGIIQCGKESISNDGEYWGDICVGLQYDEAYQSYDWNSCCRKYDCKCSTDKKGHRSCSTCCDGCYECNDTPARYYKIGASGKKYSINASEYKRIAKKFNVKPVDNGYFTKVSKGGSCGFDGKRWTISWDKTKNTAENIVSEHTYKNKVRLSSTLYAPQEVTEETKKAFGLLDYPKILDNTQDDVVGYKGFDAYPQVRQKLEYFNGQFGKKKQIKVFVWVFNKKPKETGYWQKHYIENGNKNEYNIIVSLDGEKVEWVDVATWTKVVSIENTIKGLVPMPIEDLVDSSLVLLQRDFVRTEFTPMNNIVDVDVTWGWWLAGIATNLLISTLIIIFKLKYNERI